MARIEGVERGGLLVRLAYRVARRRYGQVPEPMTLWAHSTPVLLSQAGFESGVERWTSLDPVLRDLAVLRSAQVIGCSWCLDFGTYLARKGGADEQQLQALAGWRDSDLFTPVQRLALEYAEGASSTPVQVRDGLVEELAAHLTPAAVVELAMIVAVENQRSRFNGGMGLEAQGYCVVPPQATPAQLPQAASV